MLISGHVCGAKIDVVPRPSDTGFLYSLYINPEEDLNAFDTIDLAVEPVGTAFLNYSPTGTRGTQFSFLFVDDKATFISGLLNCPVCFGSPSLTILDGSQQAPGRVSSERGIFKSMSSLGDTIISSQSHFLGNVFMPPQTTFEVGAFFLRSGEIVDRYNETVVSAPEPGNLVMLVACVAGLSVRRELRQ